MSASALPNYHVPLPQIQSPIQSIGQLMQLKNGMADLALKQEQAKQAAANTADIQAQAQQRNRDLSDQNTIQDLMKDPSVGSKIAAGDFSALDGRVQPANALKFRQAISDAHAKEATSSETDLKNKGAAISEITKAFLGHQTSFGDDVQKWNESLPGTIDRLNSQGYFKLAGIDPANLPKTVSGPEDIKSIEARLGILQGVNEGALAYKGTQSKQAQEDAAARESTAKAAHQELINKLVQDSGATPQAGATHPIDQILPASLDATANASAKAAYEAAMKTLPDENGRRPLAERVLEMASQHAASLSPANIKHKVDEEAQLEPGKIRVAQAEAVARASVATPSSDALDLMAEDALSGKAPSSRNPIVVAKVWDRAAEIAKSRGLSTTETLMARNAAQANKGAFDSITKQYETLKPFAEMAEKNANILEAALSKVSNLGASVLNTPLREIESKFTGNPDVAAFKAAILPVQADFARILNSPTGGGVLSDSARGEMERAIKPGATPGEMKAALDIFRQDAKNRKESYEASLADLKAGSVAGASKPAPSAPTPGKYKAGDTRVVNGVNYERDDQGNWHPK